MMHILLSVFLFLLQFVVSFFCALFLLRFALQWQRISFANPLGGFVRKLTDWAVLPLRRIIPGLGGMDWASVAAALLLLLPYNALLLALLPTPCANPLDCPVVSAPTLALDLLLATLLSFLSAVIYLCMALIFLDAILSWVNPYHPLSQPLRRLTQPLLAPARRLIPPISGIDLSPLVVLVCLQALLIVLASAAR